MFPKFEKRVNVKYSSDENDEKIFIVQNKETKNFQFACKITKEDENGISCGHEYKDIEKLCKNIENESNHFCEQCGSMDNFVQNLFLNKGSTSKKLNLFISQPFDMKIKELPVEIQQTILISLIDEISKENNYEEFHKDYISKISILKVTLNPFIAVDYLRTEKKKKKKKEEEKKKEKTTWDQLLNPLLSSKEFLFKITQIEREKKETENSTIETTIKITKHIDKSNENDLTLVGQRLRSLNVIHLFELLNEFLYTKESYTSFEIKIFFQLFLIIGYDCYLNSIEKLKQYIKDEKPKLELANPEETVEDYYERVERDKNYYLDEIGLYSFEKEEFNLILIQYFILLSCSMKNFRKKTGIEVVKDSKEKAIKLIQYFIDIEKNFRKKYKYDIENKIYSLMNPIHLQYPQMLLNRSNYTNEHYIRGNHYFPHLDISQEHMLILIKEYPHLTNYYKYYERYSYKIFQSTYILPKCFNYLFENKIYHFFYLRKGQSHFDGRDDLPLFLYLQYSHEIFVNYTLYIRITDKIDIFDFYTNKKTIERFENTPSSNDPNNPNNIQNYQYKELSTNEFRMKIISAIHSNSENKISVDYKFNSKIYKLEFNTFLFFPVEFFKIAKEFMIHQDEYFKKHGLYMVDDEEYAEYQYQLPTQIFKCGLIFKQQGKKQLALKYFEFAFQAIQGEDQKYLRNRITIEKELLNEVKEFMNSMNKKRKSTEKEEEEEEEEEELSNQKKRK